MANTRGAAARAAREALQAAEKRDILYGGNHALDAGPMTLAQGRTLIKVNVLQGVQAIIREIKAHIDERGEQAVVEVQAIVEGLGLDIVGRLDDLDGMPDDQ